MQVAWWSPWHNYRVGQITEQANNMLLYRVIEDASQEQWLENNSTYVTSSTSLANLCPLLLSSCIVLNNVGQWQQNTTAQDSFHLCPALSLTVFILVCHYQPLMLSLDFLSLASLCLVFSPHKPTCTLSVLDRRGNVGSYIYSNSRHKVSPSVNTNVPHNLVFINRPKGPVERPIFRSFPVHLVSIESHD